MPKEFVMRGKTGSGQTEVLQFSGHKSGHAYRMTEFQLYPSTGIGSNNDEMMATVTAGKTAISPEDPDFSNDALIAVAYSTQSTSPAYPPGDRWVINDTFLITQDLILMVLDPNGGEPVNWQCKFVKVKMNGPEEAVANYKQFTISDGS